MCLAILVWFGDGFSMGNPRPIFIGLWTTCIMFFFLYLELVWTNLFGLYLVPYLKP